MSDTLQSHNQSQNSYQQSHSHTRSRLIRLPEVLDRVPLSRTSIYARVNDGTFPKPIKLGPRAVAWLESAVEDWISNRVNQGQCGPDINSNNA